MTATTQGAPRLYPRHNPDAEISVIGAAFLDQHTIDRVELRADELYDPRLQLIWEAMLSLHLSHRPIDPVTVEAELGPQRLVAVGGLAFLSDCVTVVPSASNAEHYARIVKEDALHRRAVTALAEVLTKAHKGEAVAAELIGLAIQEIQALAAYVPDRTVEIGEAAREAMLELEEALRSKQEGKPVVWGVTTGFSDLDFLLGGLPIGVVTIVAARPSMGKAQPLDAKVLTPEGFRLMSELSVGNAIIGRDGRRYHVRRIMPQGKREIFRVTMSDGTSTETCAEHLWFTQTRAESRRDLPGGVRNLKAIADTLHVKGEPTRLNHRVPIAAPIEFAPGYRLPLDPYVLGALLGDGTLTENRAIILSRSERDVQRRFGTRLPRADEPRYFQRGVRVVRCGSRRGSHSGPSETMKALFSLRLMGTDSYTKFIPEMYRRASVQERIELLRGLFDTDGYVIDSGQRVEYATSSTRLRDDIIDVARSLGAMVTIYADRTPRFPYKGEMRTGHLSHRMLFYFPPTIIPVSSKKHLARWRPGKRAYYRRIEKIENVGTKPCQCIEVDSPDGLYVTDDYIVTHNSSFTRSLLLHANTAGHASHAISLEDARRPYALRTIADEARVNLQKLRGLEGLTRGDLTSLMSATAKIMERKHYLVDDTAGLTHAEIAMRVRKHRMRRRALGEDQKPTVVAVDYFTQVRAVRDHRDIRAAHAEVAYGLQKFARDEGIALVIVSQLNRDCEKRPDKRPLLSDLRETGVLEEIADAVLLLYRDEYYTKDECEEPGVVEVNVAKNKHGQTGTLKFTWDAATATVRPLTRRTV